MCLIEQIEVYVVVETNIANVTIMFCDEMESLDFVLESSRTDQSEDVSLLCEKSTVLPNLTPDTFYILSRRYLMGHTCEVKNFTIMGSKSLNIYSATRKEYYGCH